MNIWKFTAFCLASSLLAACAYTDDRVEVKNADVTSVDVNALSSADLMNAGEWSNGSVDVYPLDDTEFSSPAMEVPYGALENARLEAREIESVEAVPPSYELDSPRLDNFAVRGVPINSSVVVFPLDDIAATDAVGYELPIPLTDMQSSNSLQSGIDGNGTYQILFAHDSSALTESDLRLIADIAMRARSAGSISVEGHASREASIDDPVQKKIVNLRVSMGRAFSVARALMEHGVPADSIVVKGFGEARSIDDENASRRVDIIGITVP